MARQPCQREHLQGGGEAEKPRKVPPNNGPRSEGIVAEKRVSPGDFDFISDYIAKSLEKGDGPAQVRSNDITLGFWLSHFGLKIDKEIKLPTIVYVD